MRTYITKPVFIIKQADLLSNESGIVIVIETNIGSAMTMNQTSARGLKSDLTPTHYSAKVGKRCSVESNIDTSVNWLNAYCRIYGNPASIGFYQRAEPQAHRLETS